MGNIKTPCRGICLFISGSSIGCFPSPPPFSAVILQGNPPQWLQPSASSGATQCMTSKLHRLVGFFFLLPLCNKAVPWHSDTIGERLRGGADGGRKYHNWRKSEKVAAFRTKRRLKVTKGRRPLRSHLDDPGLGTISYTQHCDPLPGPSVVLT